MKNRQPTPGKEGRVLITPENGTAPYYATVTMADEPLEQGTPWAKEAVLTDDTAALFGFGVNSVPNDVFSLLGKYNIHWWSKRKKEKTVSFTGDPLSELIQTGSASQIVSVPYSDEVSVSDDGTISLKNQKTVSVSYNTYQSASILKGKYVKLYKENSSFTSEVYYITPEDSGPVQTSSVYYQISFTQGIRALKAIDNYGSTEYVQSLERTTYPDSGEQDGYEYRYLGVPFENAVTAPNIVYGSYVGTGDYGTSNPNVIELGFSPKFFVVNMDIYTGVNANGFRPYRMEYVNGSQNSYTDYVYGSSSEASKARCIVTVSSSSISWYSDSSATNQMNYANTVYHYVAFG